MTEGTLVVVVGKVNFISTSISPENLIVGTFITLLKDRQAMVLLPDGYLFIGPEHSIVLFEDQK